MRQQGFVLVATLWTLAAMTIAVGYFAGWAERAVAQAQRQISNMETEIDRRSTEAVVLYLLATRKMQTSSLDTGSPALANVQVAADDSSTEQTPARSDGGSDTGISLNDRVYRGVGSVLFSLQDEAGLVGIYSTEQLSDLLGSMGVSSDEIAVLQARLQDYVDSDDLYRIDGAEVSEYLRDGVRPPSNLPLHTTWETEAILGWNEHAALWEQSRLPRLTTATFTRHINPFTAPPRVLESLGIISSQQAAAMAEEREANEQDSVLDTFETFSPQQIIESESLAAIPARHLRLTLSAMNSPIVEELHIELTPANLYGPPWRVHTALMLPNTEIDSPPPIAEPPARPKGGAWSLFADAPRDDMAGSR